jgi:hypothetical protein
VAATLFAEVRVLSRDGYRPLGSPNYRLLMSMAADAQCEAFAALVRGLLMAPVPWAVARGRTVRLLPGAIAKAVASVRDEAVRAGLAMLALPRKASKTRATCMTPTATG